MSRIRAKHRKAHQRATVATSTATRTDASATTGLQPDKLRAAVHDILYPPTALLIVRTSKPLVRTHGHAPCLQCP